MESTPDAVAGPEPMEVDKSEYNPLTINHQQTIATEHAAIPLEYSQDLGQFQRVEGHFKRSPSKPKPLPETSIEELETKPATELATEVPPDSVHPPTSSVDMGRESVFHVDQRTSAWQSARDALEAGMSGLSNISGSQRTGGRRGRGPRRRLSPLPSGSITLKPHSSTPSNTTPSTPRRGSSTPRRGRGGGRGRGRKSFSGTKRKRGTDSEDEGGNDSSSSEEITALPSQSRSGRKITQAHHASNRKLDFEEEDEPERSPMPSPKRKPSVTASAPIASPIVTKTTPHKPALKKLKRTPGQSAVCKNCSRGPSPASNAIVFCDGCNTPWHQYCHEPPIKQDYLLDVDKDWFCADCVLLREHSVILEGKVAGHGMSVFEKRKYLKSLSPSTLVALLLHASSLYPNLPIFPPKPAVVNIDVATLEADDQGLYEEIIDELPYPKAGHGIQLRPESEDAHLLVDDNIAVYSHRWKDIAEMMIEAGWGLNQLGGVRTANGLGIRAGAA